MQTSPLFRQAGDDFEIPNYEQMVAEMALWMRAHKEMYPHYNCERHMMREKRYEQT